MEGRDKIYSQARNFFFLTYKIFWIFSYTIDSISFFLHPYFKKINLNKQSDKRKKKIFMEVIWPFDFLSPFSTCNYIFHRNWTGIIAVSLSLSLVLPISNGSEMEYQMSLIFLSRRCIFFYSTKLLFLRYELFLSWLCAIVDSFLLFVTSMNSTQQ